MTDEAPRVMLPTLVAGLRECDRCKCRSEAMQVVPGEGPEDAEILVVGQNPGSEEDVVGRPFVGRGGAELDDWFRIMGIKRDRVYITNIVKCHTTENRAPRRQEILTCQDWLFQEVDRLPRARVILPLGAAARGVVLVTEETIAPMACVWAEVALGDRRFWVLPLPHPAYLLRFGNKRPELRTLLGQVVEILKREVPDVYTRATGAV